MRAIAWMAAAFLAASAAAGCDHVFENPHLEGRGLTEEDLTAPPNATEIKSRIIRDIRSDRMLRLHLSEGRPERPKEIRPDANNLHLVAAEDETVLWRIYVTNDPPDKYASVTEVAYYDDVRRHYFYHYEGGSPFRSVWMGPFPVAFGTRRPPTEE